MKTVADFLQYSSELNINVYPRQCMNHSFFMMPLTMMQASSKRARQGFVIPLSRRIILIDIHHLQHPLTSMAGNIRRYPLDLTWVKKKKGGGEGWHATVTFRVMTLGGEWWLQWWITLCKLLSLRRFTSASSSESFPNCLLTGKHPAKLANTDSLLVIQIYWLHVVNEDKDIILFQNYGQFYFISNSRLTQSS